MVMPSYLPDLPVAEQKRNRQERKVKWDAWIAANLHKCPEFSGKCCKSCHADSDTCKGMRLEDRADGGFDYACCGRKIVRGKYKVSEGGQNV
jgi:hypothetical protein